MTKGECLKNLLIHVVCFDDIFVRPTVPVPEVTDKGVYHQIRPYFSEELHDLGISPNLVVISVDNMLPDELFIVITARKRVERDKDKIRSIVRHRGPVAVHLMRKV